MTKHDALEYALNTVIKCNDNPDVCEVLATMIAQLSKPRKTSDEVKAKAKAKRADARAELCAQVVPVLREVLSHTLQGLTAKEIFSEAQSRLPEDFTAPKVQNILLREMRPELDIVEAKGKANLYRLASVVNE